MTNNLAQYEKCIYCKHSEYQTIGDGADIRVQLCCPKTGRDPADMLDACVFFDVYTNNAPITEHKAWELKSCAFKGCNVVPSRYNETCECTACRGTHCHDCTIRVSRCKFENIYKSMARCAFCEAHQR